MDGLFVALLIGALDPHFFSVGIAGAGNHDDLSYYYPWGYKYQGRDTTTYADQANQNHAGKLEGKLLITYGTMDDNVHPNNTLCQDPRVNRSCGCRSPLPIRRIVLQDYQPW